MVFFINIIHKFLIYKVKKSLGFNYFFYKDF